jgi:hypothetical protein
VRPGLIQSVSQSPWLGPPACVVLDGIAPNPCLNPKLPQPILT